MKRSEPFRPQLTIPTGYTVHVPKEWTAFWDAVGDKEKCVRIFVLNGFVLRCHLVDVTDEVLLVKDDDGNRDSKIIPWSSVSTICLEDNRG